jgi:hypothetical protein
MATKSGHKSAVTRGKATRRSKRGAHDFAAKQTFNPPGGRPVKSQTSEPFEQDVKHRQGQFGGAGEPPLTLEAM